jgi:hypothetical protein
MHLFLQNKLHLTSSSTICSSLSFALLACAVMMMTPLRMAALSTPLSNNNQNERKREDKGVWGMGIKRGRSNGKWIYKHPATHCV